MNLDKNTYNIIKKEYGIITFEKNGLTFEEAYKLATPEYTTVIHPNNNWHVMLKYAVYKYFLQINNLDFSVSDKNKTIAVSYETKDKYSDIKITEFILEQLK